ncbi:MAG TPA: ATP-binding protein [Ktedonobacterales bacterium]|jgi:DNA replication protein DnaC
MPTRDGESTLAQNGARPCSICNGAGWLRQDLPVGDPNYGKIVKCSCKEREERTKSLHEMLERSNLGIYNEKTFETFHSNIAGVAEAYQAARKYANDPDSWLILSGQVGCGKTHLAAAIAHVCLERGMPVLFTTVPELMDHLREAFAPTNEVPYHKLFDEIREVALLVLDDLGVERTTAWVGEKLFQIVNYRYNNHIPTIITLNKDAIRELDPRIRSRMRDKAVGKWIVMEAQDYRERHSVPAKP